MKLIYQELWKRAKPYYERGRPMDVEHIEWFMEVAMMVCEEEHLDDTILLPLAILHDVGYSQVTDIQNANYYEPDIRKAHMKAGKKIAEQILLQINYPLEKIAVISHDIAVHDNWAYGEVDLYLDDPILGTFKDLDYLWIYTKAGCMAIQKVLGKTSAEMLLHLQGEPSPIGGKKPFSNPTTKRLHDEYLKERMNDLNFTA